MTPRQQQILASIIKEFMDSAEPVGSLVISEKHDLGVSPATIRNEMAELAKQGYIEKSHVSAGRFPTSLGFRFYINDLLEPERISQMEELEIGRRLFAQRFAKERLVKHAVDVLAESTRNAVIALLDNTVFSAGFADLTRYPEFYDVKKLREVMIILENHQILHSMFQRAKGDHDRKVRVLVGEETGVNSFDSCSVVFSNFKVHGGQQGVLAAVGPARMNYRKIIPMVDLVADKLNNAVLGW